MTVEDKKKVGVTVEDKKKVGVTVEDKWKVGVTVEAMAQRTLTVTGRLSCWRWTDRRRGGHQLSVINEGGVAAGQ